MFIQLDRPIICTVCLLLLFLVVFFRGIDILMISWDILTIRLFLHEGVCTLLHPCSLIFTFFMLVLLLRLGLLVLHLRLVPLFGKILVTFRLGHVGLAQQLQELSSGAHGARDDALVTGNSVL